MGEMTAEERDELRAALEAAGCPYLAGAIGGFLGGAYITELRSLLRREERLRVMEAGVRAAEWRDIANGAETQESEGANG